MNYQKLKERQVFVKATPYSKHTNSLKPRRTLPNNYNDLKLDPIDKEYESFFDYEDGILEQKTAAQLYAESLKSEEESVKSEWFNEEIKNNTLDEPANISTLDEVLELSDKIDKTEFVAKFTQCTFIKDNGDQCKRQGPKKTGLCAKHSGVK